MRKLLIIWCCFILLILIPNINSGQREGNDAFIYLHDFKPDTSRKINYFMPAIQIISINLIINRFDYHVSGLEWANVNPSSWWINLNKGFMTDGDAFATNWFGHPIHGSLAYNAARINRLSLFEATPYVLGHSMMWEYFAETEPPSAIDFYTTTFGGIYLGEVTYRISDYAWNHPSRYEHQSFRNIIGGLINPVAAINRWLLGNKLPMTKHSFTPLVTDINAGFIQRLNNTSNQNNKTGQFAGLEIDYGYPDSWTEATIYPFDRFKVKTWLTYINTSKNNNEIYFNLKSDAVILAKQKTITPTMTFSHGLSQHYDFIHNDRFKLSNIALTFDNEVAASRSNIYAKQSLKAGLIIYGSSNSEYVKPVLPHIFERFNRDYIYGHGLVIKSESTFNFKDRHHFGMSLNYFKINSKENPDGAKDIMILQSKYQFPVYKNWQARIQYEHYQSNSDLTTSDEVFKGTEKFNEATLSLLIRL